MVVLLRMVEAAVVVLLIFAEARMLWRIELLLHLVALEAEATVVAVAELPEPRSVFSESLGPAVATMEPVVAEELLPPVELVVPDDLVVMELLVCSVLVVTVGLVATQGPEVEAEAALVTTVGAVAKVLAVPVSLVVEAVVDRHWSRLGEVSALEAPLTVMASSFLLGSSNQLKPNT